MNADQALEALIAGNKQFVKTSSQGKELQTKVEDAKLNEQKPFAIVLGCSDSRVPAELVFDQGFGDLFVIRVAGNIVAPSQIGSVEFACQQFGTQLVVVLGHSKCGAIAATVDALLSDTEEMSPNIGAIVDRVTPAVLPIIEECSGGDRDELLQKSMRANVEQSVRMLRMRSRILRGLVNRHQLRIVGAEFCIETGEVSFRPTE
jgi:carbonic anhydrase